MMPKNIYKPFTVPPEVVDEVLHKTDRTINIETAYKWAARAVVAYIQFTKTESFEWLLRAEDYRHEALEHAALVGDNGVLTGMLEAQIDAYRPANMGEL
jgi:hypothetical protein